MTGLLDSEEKSKRELDPKMPPELPSIEELQREAASFQGLCRQESLEIFAVWHRYKGDQGLTLTEIINMPAWLRRDFDTIFASLGKERRTRKAREGFGERRARNKGNK